jgi:hypothetical protein
MASPVLPACKADGQAVGQYFTTIFLPSGISDNGPDSYLTFYAPRNTYSIKMAGRPVAGVAYSGIYINSYGRHTTAPNGTIVAASILPTTITATSPFINFVVRISNGGHDHRLHRDPAWIAGATARTIVMPC